MTDDSGLRLVTTDIDATFLPAHAIGGFLPVCQHDIAMFNDAFSDEIDSWMSSSLACCDACYDDFAAHWPGVTFRDMEFQRQSTDISWFFETSRLREVYSEAEFSTLINFVSCPRCDAIIRTNFWIFEHLFSDVPEIERAIDELSALGKRTPFLLLEHQFAKEVLDAIRSHSAAVARKALPSRLFRARAIADLIRLGQSFDSAGSFGPAPADRVGEGRFNHAGNSVLYVADTLNTARLEIGGKTEEVCVAELDIGLGPSLVLDLVELDEDATSFEILSAVASSALLAGPNTGTGWSKPQYVFSRFVADCARSAGFDAIRYGSTKDSNGSNFVLLDPAQDFAERTRLVGVDRPSA
ncbi:RES family NAD+ phosphorylase [Devosia sp.]|uniref:RES family NAD+ phosphorylase n=1 Tax=Devosia sp. TaxID=1871048 RepID=UPI001A07C843|nr:RES family NAD+ phosphorylase [Devosia sp.]MBE0581261.1 RES family NAD+ phosphorylase [Devosia sp.]